MSMRIYFAGLGGVGIGPLALLSRDMGHDALGSDNARSRYSKIIESYGISIHYDQSGQALREVHSEKSIDWFVYTSALAEDHPELTAAKELGIKISERNELLNHLINEKSLKLIGVSGTHGKSTTTAMLVWLFKQLKVPVAYSVGTDLPFGPSAAYEAEAKWFVYEADEFNRNMLAFNPDIAVLTEIGFDHPETYKDEADYQMAFQKFKDQSKYIIDQKDYSDSAEFHIAGKYNRIHAQMVRDVFLLIDKNADSSQINGYLNRFPGAGRRFEKLADNLYTDYAHHPDEIKATLSLAREVAGNKKIVVVYEPHQNFRQHALADKYGDCFKESSFLYWLPTYLTREDKQLNVLKPQEIMVKLNYHGAIQSAEMNNDLVINVRTHLKNGDLVVIMGAGPVDDWARKELK